MSKAPIGVGKLITVAEAAKMAGVHDRTMYRRLVRLDALHGGKLLMRMGGKRSKLYVRFDALMSLLSTTDTRAATMKDYDELCEAIRSLENTMNRRLKALAARLREAESKCKSSAK